MADVMTVQSDADVDAYIAGVEPEQRRLDAIRLNELFQEVTGFEPVVWGTSIIGYGRYDYTYKTGHSGSSLATGFAPRKREQVLYIMPGYAELQGYLDRLGPHRTGKACLYITRLARVDEAVLREIIEAGLEDLATRWTIHPR